MSIQINNLQSQDASVPVNELSGLSQYLQRNQDRVSVFKIEGKASLIPDDESVLELDADDEYNYEDGDDDYDDDDDDNEDEDLIVKGMVEAAFSGRMTEDELKRILQRDDDDDTDGPMRKKIRFTTTGDDDNMEQRRQSIPKSVSSDSLQGTTSNTSSGSINRSRYDHPAKYLRQIFESVSKEYQIFSASDVKDFFVRLTDENIIGYDSALVQALYSNNVTKLRTLLDDGHTMQCGNKFGETVVHTVCRRGLYDALQFLITDAGVSIQVVCDSGRTPLHDACWTTKPNWNIINLLLDTCPDLLYISDNRGYTPLDYIPKQLWYDWCEYLDRRGVNGLQRQIL